MKLKRVTLMTVIFSFLLVTLSRIVTAYEYGRIDLIINNHKQQVETGPEFKNRRTTSRRIERWDHTYIRYDYHSSVDSESFNVEKGDIIIFVGRERGFGAYDESSLSTAHEISLPREFSRILKITRTGEDFYSSSDVITDLNGYLEVYVATKDLTGAVATLSNISTSGFEDNYYGFSIWSPSTLFKSAFDSTDLKSELANVKSSLAELTKQNTRLTQQKQQLETKLNEIAQILGTDTSTAITKINELKQHLTDKQADLDSVRDSVQEIKTILSQNKSINLPTGNSVADQIDIITKAVQEVERLNQREVKLKSIEAKLDILGIDHTQGLEQTLETLKDKHDKLNQIALLLEGKFGQKDGDVIQRIENIFQGYKDVLDELGLNEGDSVVQRLQQLKEVEVKYNAVLEQLNQPSNVTQRISELLVAETNLLSIYNKVDELGISDKTKEGVLQALVDLKAGVDERDALRVINAQLRLDKQELETIKQYLKVQKQKLTDELNNTKQSLQNSLLEIDTLKDRLLASQKDAEGLRKSLEQTEGQLTRKVKELEGATKSLESAKNTLKTTTDKLDLTKTNLDNTTKTLSNRESELNATKSELDKAKSNLKAKEGEVSRTQSDVSSKVSEISRLKSEISSLKELVETLKKQLSLAQSKNSLANNPFTGSVVSTSTPKTPTDNSLISSKHFAKQYWTREEAQSVLGKELTDKIFRLGLQSTLHGKLDSYISRGEVVDILSKLSATDKTSVIRNYTGQFENIFKGDEYYEPIKTLYSIGVLEVSSSKQFEYYLVADKPFISQLLSNQKLLKVKDIEKVINKDTTISRHNLKRVDVLKIIFNSL